MQGQEDTKLSDNYLDISLGFGVVSENDPNIVLDAQLGIVIQTEYVITSYSWFSMRPYVGYINVSSNNASSLNGVNSIPYYEVSSNALIIGGKGRFTAPIPWVAPYIEAGYGVSVGSFSTITSLDRIEKNGVVGHIPIAIGLSIGRKEKFEIELNFLQHNSIKQTTGSFLLGISIPIEDVKNFF